MTLSSIIEAAREAEIKLGWITREEVEARAKPPSPEGVPPIVVYLATDEAANINGQMFHTDASRISLHSELVEIKTIYNTHPAGEFITVDKLVELVPKMLAQGLVDLGTTSSPRTMASGPSSPLTFSITLI